MALPGANELTPLCIAKGESLLRVFPSSVAFITRYRGHGPVEVLSSSTKGLSSFLFVM